MLVCFRGGLEVIDSDQISKRPPELRRWGFWIRRKLPTKRQLKWESHLAHWLCYTSSFFWIMTSDFSRVIRSCRWSVKLHVVFTNHGHMQATENDPTGKRWKHHPSDDELRRMLGWKKQEGISCLSKRKTHIFWRSFFCLFQSVSSHGVCHVMNSSQHFEINLGQLQLFCLPSSEFFGKRCSDLLETRNPPWNVDALYSGFQNRLLHSGKESIYSSLRREIFTNFPYPLLKYYGTHTVQSLMCIIANQQWH